MRVVHSTAVVYVYLSALFLQGADYVLFFLLVLLDLDDGLALGCSLSLCHFILAESNDAFFLFVLALYNALEIGDELVDGGLRVRKNLLELAET